MALIYMALRPTPIRIDPVKLLKDHKLKSPKSKSRKSPRKSPPKPKKSRPKSKSRSKSRSRPRSKSPRKKIKIKLTKKEQQKYQVPVLTRKPLPDFNSSNRVSPERAILQRLSPFFGQDHDNRGSRVTEPETLSDLKRMDRKTRKKPILNQLVKENILVRAGNINF